MRSRLSFAITASMALLVFYGLARVDESTPGGIGDAAGVLVVAGGEGGPGGPRRWAGVRVSDVIGSRDDEGAPTAGGDGTGAPGAVAGPGGASERDHRLPAPIPVVRGTEEPPGVAPPARPVVTTTARPKPKPAASRPAKSTTTSTTTTTIPPNREEGSASWYEAATPGNCAHRSIAKSTTVKVINLENGRSVTCVVNDRGPYLDGRVIDLSQADFEALAPTGRGLVPVRIEWR